MRTPSELDSITTSILHSLNIAVLVREKTRQYMLLGTTPPFYAQMFPGRSGEGSNEPWEHSFMLEFFFEDAELFFERNAQGVLHSGVWQESDVCNFNQALTASAVVEGENKFITIRLLEEDFAQRARILQKAREQLLEHHALHQHLEKYKREARIDPLTKLLNKTAFLEIVEDEVGRAVAQEIDLSLLTLEIDRYKDIVDKQGHLVGEKILTYVGSRLTSILRAGDIVARYGGEKFTILAPHTPPMRAYLLAEKLCTSIIEDVEKELPEIGINIGCAAYIRGEAIGSFIQRSDLALYDAKRSGINQVKIR